MHNYEKIVAHIENLMDQSLSALKELDPENFKEKFKLAYSSLDNARKLRRSMAEDKISDNLRGRLKKVNFTAKLIEEAYDNVVQNHKAEEKNIALAIKNTRNEKKIATYTRG